MLSVDFGEVLADARVALSRTCRRARLSPKLIDDGVAVVVAEDVKRRRRMRMMPAASFCQSHARQWRSPRASVDSTDTCHWYSVEPFQFAVSH